MNFNKIGKRIPCQRRKAWILGKAREQRTLFDACRFGDWRNG